MGISSSLRGGPALGPRDCHSAGRVARLHGGSASLLAWPTYLQPCAGSPLGDFVFQVCGPRTAPQVGLRRPQIVQGALRPWAASPCGALDFLAVFERLPVPVFETFARDMAATPPKVLCRGTFGPAWQLSKLWVVGDFF